MNRAYKLVWNTVSNNCIVASELAKGRKKSSGKTLTAVLALLGGLAGTAYAAVPAASQLPVGEILTGGTATVDRSVANQLTINQTTTSLLGQWDSFDVGKDAKVIINQPTSTSFSFHSVMNSANPTQIMGQVQTNGQFVLTNQSGIVFGKGSQVSASAIVASSVMWDSISGGVNQYTFNQFMNGSSIGSIENHGTLTATAGGVTLLAPSIINDGAIHATGGNVNLINAYAVDFTYAEPSIVTPSSTLGLIRNSGSITATQVSSVGGKILLTGDTSQTASKIQLGGTLDATTETSVNGRSIQVTKVLDINGTDNTLKLTHVDGYSLTGGAVNLTGANSGFSVNGDAYTVIRNVNQLQNMTADRSGKYALANNIDASATSGWNSGAGFNPIGDFIGNGSTEFTGNLDGLGHVVNGLYINRPSEDDVALLGATYGADLRNIGLSNVNLTGSEYVGGLISDANSNSKITNSFVSGTLSGERWVGGLVGSIYAGGVISNSYSSAAASASDTYVGGLVGMINNATISGSYASGAVTSGAGFIGGLVGNASAGTISNSYWNTTTSQQTIAVGGGSPTQTNVVGLTDTQSKQLSSYASWGSSIDAQGGTGNTWRIYDGQNAPLLRTFLKTLDVSVNNADGSKTYDGTSSTINAAYNILDAQADTSKVKVNNLAVRNAGTYNYSSALYSTQDGYDLSFVDDATFTINKKQLTITATAASKVYDGRLTSSGKPVVLGRQRGDAIVGLTQSYLDKNAGTGKTIHVDAGYTIRDGNGGNNYDVVIVNSTAGVITPKAVTISTVANSKVYDGGLTSANKPLVTGLITGDRITGLYQQYETKTVGENKKLLIKSGYVVQDGNSGGNYSVTEQGSMDGVITAH